jgi:protein-disulfide isomerase
MSPSRKDAVTLGIALGVVALIGLLVLFLDVFFPAPDIELPSAATASSVPETDSDSLVTIVGFSDFECPFCGRAAQTIGQLKDIYGGSLHVDYRHFPTHSNSQKAAEASECAREQGMFWEYHDLLYESGALDTRSLKEHAEGLGLDMARFIRCLDGGEKTAVVVADFQEGQRLQIRGTPTFFINDKVLEGAQPLESFKRVIDNEMAQAASR